MVCRMIASVRSGFTVRVSSFEFRVSSFEFIPSEGGWPVRSEGTDRRLQGSAAAGKSLCRRRVRRSMRYRVVLQQSEEGFSVSCPGLPGCWSQGASDAEALENVL